MIFASSARSAALGSLLLTLAACKASSAGASAGSTGGSGATGSGGSTSSTGSGGATTTTTHHSAGDPRLLYVDEGGVLQSAFTDGTQPQALSPAGWFCQTPAWSPDGKRIAFAADDGTSGHQQLYVMSAAGGTPVLVVPWDGAVPFDDVSSPSWSKKNVIAFQTRTDFSSGSVTSVSMVSPDGDSFVPIVIGQESSAPAWSPDGTQLAVNVSGTGDSDLWIYLDSSHQSHVTGPFNGDLLPTWTPDGKSLVYVRDDEGTGYAVHRIQPDGSGEAVIVTLDHAAGKPSVSPDGETVAVGLTLGAISSELVTVTLATGAMTTLVQNALDPQYQP
jgi:Tol biopolymer transport system component